MGYNYAACTAIGLLFPILAIFAMGMRGYSYFRYSKTTEIDDYLIIPAFLLTLTAGIAMTVGSEMRIIGGHSLPAILPDEQHKLGKLEYAFWMGHVVTVGFIKLSILFFFRRLFKGRTKRTAFDICNWTLIVLVVLWTLTFLFADIFACGIYPRASWSTQFWRHNVCINTFAMMLGSASSNWIMDLAILIEPLLMINGLHLVSTRKKLQASAVFLLSIFAVIAGLLRMILWIQVNIGGHAKFIYSLLGVNYPITDLEAIATLGIYWTYVEMGVGFLVAALLPSAKLIDSLSSAFERVRSLKSRFPDQGSSCQGRKDSDKGSLEDAAPSFVSTVEAKKQADVEMRQYDLELDSIDNLTAMMEEGDGHIHGAAWRYGDQRV